jgi:phosphatidate cytidylyltransferase
MLKQRLITGLVLLFIVLGCLFAAPPAGWQAFVLVMLSLASWEWSRLAKFSRGEMLLFVGTYIALAVTWLLLPLARGWDVPLDIFSLVFWAAVVPWWLSRKPALQSKWLAALVGWLLLLAALSAMVRLHSLPVPPLQPVQSALAMLLIIAIAWVADIAAYFVGRRFGQRKLAPSISPGKSWEGVYGGVLGVTIYVLALHFGGAPLFDQIPLVALLPLAWGLTAISVVGDLFESLLKRQAGVKDSSNLLPGHGGVLDRIDSMLALAPVAAALYFGYLRFA